MAEPQRGPRARYREQTRAEIKEVALRQLADGGAGTLALTRIAKALGLSGPALYRYFASRDDLLNALIRDAYDDAAAAIGEAAARAQDRSPRERLRVLATAYRAWAVSEPHRYALIQGSPVPGYVAPDDTLERARAALGPFLPVFAGGSPGADAASMVDRMAAWLETDAGVGSWVAQYAPDAAEDVRASARALAGAVLAWAQLHGAVGLEVAGQFAGMGHDGETLLAAQSGMLADAFGLE
ncbi:TetR/AcrR family transcriptional regulator [Streptomyces sp. NPDC057249]|uniref:TetR/AcrR family transcriptional regulator n=1 Tax=Streptomyces sp. NPDC057249 TaxID=3346067 RepID=UPI00363FAB7B